MCHLLNFPDPQCPDPRIATGSADVRCPAWALHIAGVSRCHQEPWHGIREGMSGQAVGGTTRGQGLRTSAKDVGYGQFTLTLSISRPNLPACRVLTQRCFLVPISALAAQFPRDVLCSFYSHHDKTVQGCVTLGPAFSWRKCTWGLVKAARSLPGCPLNDIVPFPGDNRLESV